MGFSYVTLSVGNVTFTMRDDEPGFLLLVPNALTFLFAADELTATILESEELEGDLFYSAPAGAVKQRLDAHGYTLGFFAEIYDEWRDAAEFTAAEWLPIYAGDDVDTAVVRKEPLPAHEEMQQFLDLLRRAMSAPGDFGLTPSFTFEGLQTSLFREPEKLTGAQLRFLALAHGNYDPAVPQILPLLFTRLALEVVDDSAQVVLDLEDLVEGEGHARDLIKSYSPEPLDLSADAQARLRVAQALESHSVTAREAAVALAHAEGLPTGAAHANEFHESIIPVLRYVFESALTSWEKEFHMDQGRGRIDLICDNIAGKGIFSDWKDRYNAFHIPVECKNMAAEPKNDEFNQLEDRMGRKSSRIGMVVCRETGDLDAVRHQQAMRWLRRDNLVLVFTTGDLGRLLALRAAHDIAAIEEELGSQVREVMYDSPPSKGWRAKRRAQQS